MKQILFLTNQFNILQSMASSTLRALLLALALVVMVNCVTLKNGHQAEDSEDETYLAALEENQDATRAAVDALVEINEEVENTIEQVEKVDELKIVALEEGLADERDALDELVLAARVPYPAKTIECKDYSDSEIEDIEEAIESLEETLEEVKDLITETLNSEEDEQSTRNVEIETQGAELEANLMRMKELAASRCPPIKDTPSEVIDTAGFIPTLNLKDTKWVSSDKYTDSDYYDDLMPLLLLGYSVKKCPTEKPWVMDGGNISEAKCFACTEDKPVFDLENKQCIMCPENTTYLERFHSCVEASETGLLACAECNEGQVFDLNTLTCGCPEDKPYVTNDDECITCYYPKFWSNDTKTCQSCPVGMIFDLEDGSCTPCPEDTPLFIGNKCIACGEGQHYSVKKNRCRICPGNTIFSDEFDGCVCPEGYHWMEKKQVCIRKVIDYTEVIPSIPCDLIEMGLSNRTFNKLNDNNYFRPSPSEKCHDQEYRCDGKCYCKTGNIFVSLDNKKTFECFNCAENGYAYDDELYRCVRIKTITKFVEKCDYQAGNLSTSLYETINDKKFYFTPEENESCPKHSFGCKGLCYCDYGFVPQSTDGVYSCFGCEDNGWTFSEIHYNCVRKINVEREIIVKIEVCDYKSHGLSKSTYNYLKDNKRYVTGSGDSCPKNSFQCDGVCYCTKGSIPRKNLSGEFYCFNCAANGYKYNDETHTCQKVIQQVETLDAIGDDGDYRFDNKVVGSKVTSKVAVNGTMTAEELARLVLVNVRVQTESSTETPSTRTFTESTETESTETESTETETGTVLFEGKDYSSSGYSSRQIEKLISKDYHLWPLNGECADNSFLYGEKCYCHHGYIPFTDDKTNYYCYNCEEHDKKFDSSEYHCISE